jgi:DNA-directed RNA polymerase specialized sigma24 family protein
VLGPSSEARPRLEIVRGLIYRDRQQIFNRWLLPTYKEAFRWTGNEPDAQEVSAWVLRMATAELALPAAAGRVDDQVGAATLQGIARHWSDRYALDLPAASIERSAAALERRPRFAFEELIGGLGGEERRLVVLRFLRRRSNTAVAAQLDISAQAAEMTLARALLNVAMGIGVDAGQIEPPHTAAVAGFVEDLVRRRRPVRFEASPAAWAALVAACHLQASITGNDLPSGRYIRQLTHEVLGAHSRRGVTALRIWSA